MNKNAMSKKSRKPSAEELRAETRRLKEQMWSENAAALKAATDLSEKMFGNAGKDPDIALRVFDIIDPDDHDDADLTIDGLAKAQAVAVEVFGDADPSPHVVLDVYDALNPEEDDEDEDYED